MPHRRHFPDALSMLTEPSVTLEIKTVPLALDALKTARRALLHIAEMAKLMLVRVVIWVRSMAPGILAARQLANPSQSAEMARSKMERPAIKVQRTESLAPAAMQTVAPVGYAEMVTWIPSSVRPAILDH